MSIRCKLFQERMSAEGAHAGACKSAFRADARIHMFPYLETKVRALIRYAAVCLHVR